MSSKSLKEQLKSDRNYTQVRVCPVNHHRNIRIFQAFRLAENSKISEGESFI